jgi:antitoxin CptB
MSEVETDAARRKRLRFRAWHRGFREADLILGPFADAHVAHLGAADLDAFEKLLAVPDHDLHDWVIGLAAAPEAFRTALFARLCEYARQRTGGRAP